MAYDSDRAATFRVLGEIAEERDRQIDRHGHDPDKDDRQPMAWWGWLLARRATDLSCPVQEVVGDSPRRQLLEIAAIAVAALESLDRRDGGREVTELAAAGPLPGCTCGFRAQLPRDHRGGCIYSGYPETVTFQGREYRNPHWLTVTDDSELVVDDPGDGGPPIIMASYTPTDREDDGTEGRLDAYGYRPTERPWAPYPKLDRPMQFHSFCLWHGCWFDHPDHEGGPSCEPTDNAPPWYQGPAAGDE